MDGAGNNTMAFKGHCYIYYPICTKKYGFGKIDEARYGVSICDPMFGIVGKSQLLHVIE